MFSKSAYLQQFLHHWPGRKRFGMYRFMPMFFLLGAALEFSMINWHVGEVNFYKVYKKREVQKRAQGAMSQN